MVAEVDGSTRVEIMPILDGFRRLFLLGPGLVYTELSTDKEAYMLKQGSKGQEVRALQDKLIKLGFEMKSDGDFGKETDGAVRKLQALFNYSVDGIVGPGTNKLIDQQIDQGWNVQAADAVARAQASNPVKHV